MLILNVALNPPGLPQLYYKLRNCQACGIPLSNYATWNLQFAVRLFSYWQSEECIQRSAFTALQIWARGLAIVWNQATAIFQRETPCLKRRIFLIRDFLKSVLVKLTRCALFRLQYPFDKLSRDTIPSMTNSCGNKMLNQFHTMTMGDSFTGLWKETAVPPLKGQCHEIFDPQFFHQSIPLGHLIHGLKPFRI
jgi:hypothetical protein